MPGSPTPIRSPVSFRRLDLDDGEEPATEALARQAAVAEEAALAHPRITNSEGAEAKLVAASRTTLVATNGFVGASARSSHSIGASVIAGANGAMERDYEYRTVVRARDLPDPAEIGRTAAERAVARLNPRKVKSRAVPIVFDPRVAGSMVRHLAGAISGPAVARGTTFLKDKLGQPVFAAGVTIVDDPLRPDGLRSRAFDAEGIRTERRRAGRPGRADHLAAGLRLGPPARPVDHRPRRTRRLARRPRRHLPTPTSRLARCARTN